MDNGCDVPAKALQAQIALTSSQSSRAARSLRTSCFTRRKAWSKRPESGRFVPARAGRC